MYYDGWGLVPIWPCSGGGGGGGGGGGILCVYSCTYIFHDCGKLYLICNLIIVIISVYIVTRA